MSEAVASFQAGQNNSLDRSILVPGPTGITADRGKDVPADQDSEAQTSVAVEPSLVAHLPVAFLFCTGEAWGRGLGATTGFLHLLGRYLSFFTIFVTASGVLERWHIELLHSVFNTSIYPSSGN